MGKLIRSYSLSRSGRYWRRLIKLEGIHRSGLGILRLHTFHAFEQQKLVGVSSLQQEGGTTREIPIKSGSLPLGRSLRRKNLVVRLAAAFRRDSISLGATSYSGFGILITVRFLLSQIF